MCRCGALPPGADHAAPSSTRALVPRPPGWLLGASTGFLSIELIPAYAGLAAARPRMTRLSRGKDAGEGSYV
jgi:hypothetical protein